MEWLLYWLIATNLIGFVLMVWDKAKAQSGERRIAESTLISWSMLGGSIGTLTASLVIRHKTRKQPISTMLRAIPVVQLLLGIAWLSGLLDPVVETLLSQYA